ncbi:HVA22-like protein i [Iris pallida]|uniref:HVA22-like protein n=1 Tax=Iris pallida TaxID=29817 RepID=A0AAX6G4J9_IRIPA|nr:HVA22-like protein i [Iris pallida]
MVGFLTRGLALVLGYAYPAYECFKTVELNKPEIEQLRFWCQYWILVAALTVFERVGDTFVSWLPMYGEAKLVFFVYMWFPKTRGTTYVYETFFRPYVAKHEMEIDRNLLELRTRAGDMVVLYFQKAASYGQTRVFEILQFVAAQSQSQPSRPRPQQQQAPEQVRQPRHLAVSQQAQQPARQPPPPSSPSKSLLQQTTKAADAPSVTLKSLLQETAKAAGAPSATLPSPQAHPPARTFSVPNTAAAQPQPPVRTFSVPGSSATTTPSAPSEAEVMQVAQANTTANNGVNPPHQETHIEEAIRVTRGRLRKRAAMGKDGTQ